MLFSSLFQVTPLERLDCMKHILDNIINDVEKQQQQRMKGRVKGGGGGGSGGSEATVGVITINSDDLIPVLCAVVTK